MSSPSSMSDKLFVCLALILMLVPATAEVILSKSVGQFSSPGSTGDGGPATSAKLTNSDACSFDSTGVMYIADSSRVRNVNTVGIISTVFGYSDSYQLLGDNGAATSAGGNVVNVRLDTAGNLFLTDNTWLRVRRISNGIIYPVAGGGTSSSAAAATSLLLTMFLYDALPDTAGNVYIPSVGTNQIKKVAVSTGVVKVIAGTGNFNANEGVTLNGNGGQATSADITPPLYLWLDTVNRLYFSAAYGFSVRRIDLTSGIISFVAGNGGGSYSGYGIPATSIGLGNNPGVTADTLGNMYLTNRDEPIIRKVDHSTSIVSLYVGGGTLTGSAMDGQPAVDTSLDQVYISYALDDKLYFTDTLFSVVLMAQYVPPTEPPTAAPSVSSVPSAAPSLIPTDIPSLVPSVSPLAPPSVVPSVHPSFVPTTLPSVHPSFNPSETPSLVPSVIPTIIPSLSPTMEPSITPSAVPSRTPSNLPTVSPTAPTKKPTALPTVKPTRASASTFPTFAFTSSPTAAPTTHVDISFNVSLYLFNTSDSSLSGADKSAVVSAVSGSMNVSSGDVSVSGSTVIGSGGGRRLSDAGAPSYDLFVSLMIHASTADHRGMNGSALYRELSGALYGAVESKEFQSDLTTAAQVFGAVNLYYVSDVNLTVLSYIIVQNAEPDSDTANNNNDDGVSSGDFAGIVIGIIVSFVILVSCCYYAVACFNSSGVNMTADVIRDVA